MIFEDAKKQVVSIFEDDYNKLTMLNNEDLYFNEEATKKHLKHLKECFYALINNLKDYDDVINLFTISKNNNKKIKGYNIVSYAPYYLCTNLLNNNCMLCGRCYGAKNERFKAVINYRLKNYIFFNFLYALKFILNYNDLYHFILWISIKENKSLITPKIRLNQQSDIKNNQFLEIFNDMFIYMKHESNNKDLILYTYTKTLDLNLKALEEGFLINKSIVINNKNIEDLTKLDVNELQYICVCDKNIKLDSKKFKKCLNDCFNCNNCSTLFKKSSNIKYTYLH